MALHTVSVSIKTTGVNHLTDDLLEIGLVYSNLSLPILNTSEQLRIVLPTKYIKGHPNNICLNYELIKEISDYPNSKKVNTLYLDPSRVNYYIEDWLSNLDQIRAVINLNIAGKNFASKSAPFLFNVGVNFNNYRFCENILDPGTMYITKEDSTVPSLEECLQRANLTKEPGNTSIDNAIDVLKVLHYKLHL